MGKRQAEEPETNVVDARVYFEPDTGEIRHVQQVVAARGETLSTEQVEELVRAFEEGLTDATQLRSLVMDTADMPRSWEAFKVDVANERLVRRPEANPS